MLRCTTGPNEILNKLGKLPAFQPVVSRILQLSPSSGEDIEQIIAIIETDAAFGAEMLRVANSPLFGLHSTVHSVRHAVVVLGLERTKALAFRVAMETFLENSLKYPAVSDCWLHSLACAEIARHMSAACGHEPKDCGYTGGLLHDIGRLALLKSRYRDYAPLFGSQYESVDDAIEAERELLGFDHGAAGEVLCGLWNFPAEMGEIASHHHEQVSGRENSLLNIVRLSCQMAGSLGFDAVRCDRRLSFQEIRETLPARMQQRFRFSPDELNQLILDRAGSVESAATRRKR